MQSKRFHLAALLCISTGRNIPTPGMGNMENVYDILDFMPGKSLLTHELPDAAARFKPEVEWQFPFLKDIDIVHMSGSWNDRLNALVSQYGEYFEVQSNAQKGQ